MNVSWWDSPQTERIEKWVAYLAVPLLFAVTTTLLLVAFDTRATVIEQHQRRTTAAETRNEELVEELRLIQSQLRLEGDAPGRTEVFNSVEDIERKIDRLLEEHDVQGSLDSGSS